MTRVLLVEDDNDLRDLVKAELELEGLHIEATKCALEFYKALAKDDFDIVILDVSLPDESGLKIAQYVRQNTALGIIMLTALGSSEDRKAGYSFGADIYFVKPVSGQELALAVKNLSARVSPHADNNNKTKFISPSMNTKETSWHFDSVTWSLLSPNGKSSQLSGKEKLFLDTITQLQNEPTTRNTLLKTLNYPDNEYGQHALETLVLRLRKKISSVTTEPIPIKTIRGVGYQFTAGLVLK